MQRLDNLFALLFLPVRFVLVQERVQIFVLREDLGTNEVEQREQFLQIVLQRSSRDEQPTSRRE